MGPFVPDIISDELSLVFGFLIGIAFGFVLEQAGFSSSRKLTGLFYGKDFTVLRVFFTAAITAMIGILVSAHFGLLDIDIIYINPTYLWAAIIGGVIMGIGFVVGGYCPGTSICGAAIGKIDAIVFVLGGILGVFFFGEMYPYLEGVFNGYYYGDVTVPSALGISPGLFVLGIIVIAIGAFFVTTKIEKRLNPLAVSNIFPVRTHTLAGAIVIVIGIVLVFLPDRKAGYLDQLSDERVLHNQSVHSISIDEVAFRILDDKASIQIIDVRSDSEFSKLRLPGAVNIPLNNMFGKQWRDILQTRKLKVFVASDEMGSRKAAILAHSLDYPNIRFLSGGFNEFKTALLTNTSIQNDVQPLTPDQIRFRTKASSALTRMIKDELAGPKKQVKVLKKVAGGCGA